MEVTGSPGDAAGSGALLKTGLKSIVSCVVVTVNLRYPLDFVIVEFKDHIFVLKPQRHTRDDHAVHTHSLSAPDLPNCAGNLRSARPESRSGRCCGSYLVIG